MDVFEVLDKEILAGMVEDYEPKVLLRVLRDVLNQEADKLVDLQLNDKAKEVSLAAHHLTIFVGE